MEGTDKAISRRETKPCGERYLKALFCTCGEVHPSTWAELKTRFQHNPVSAKGKPVCLLCNFVNNRFWPGGAEDRSRHHRKTNVFFGTGKYILSAQVSVFISSSLCIQNWNECCPKMKGKSNTMGQTH